MKVKRESEVVHSCPTLSDPMDCSLPGFSVHGIFQALVEVKNHATTPPPESAVFSAKKEPPSYKEFPSPGKGEKTEQQASPASGVTVQMFCFDFTLHRLTKLRCIRMVRNKKKSRGY